MLENYSYEKQLLAQKDDSKLDVNPSIGIIMPVYNSSKTLRESIKGILNQSYSNWKLFIIDDCSTEPFDFSEFEDKRIQITKLDNNVGPSESRNVALKMIAKEGLEYIALCDSDDVWISKDHLKENLKFLIVTEGDICYSDVECVFEDGTPAFLWVEKDGNSERITFHDDMKYEELLKSNWIYTSTILMKNLGLFFDKSMDGIEDWDHWLKALENNYSIYHLNRVHVRYLVKSSGVACWSDETKRDKIKNRKLDPIEILRSLLN